MSSPAQAPEGPDTASRLLRAARTVFARQGYEGASIRAITGRAGVNLGAVTYHYGSKRELYDAVAEEVVGPLRARVEEAMTGESAPLRRLEAVVRAFFQHLEENPDLPHFMLQEVVSGRAPAPAVMRTIQAVMGHLAGAVREGRADGTIRDVDPLLAAVSTVSQPVHFTLVGKLLAAAADLEIDDPTTRERVTEHAVRFVRAGLSAPDTSKEGEEEG